MTTLINPLLLSDDIVNYFEQTGLIDGFNIQYSEWIEDPDLEFDRYLVIFPDGGPEVMQWGREPRYRVVIVGKKSESYYAGEKSVGVITSKLIEYIRFNGYSECHGMIRVAAEPMPPIRTTGGRPMTTFNLLTMTRG